MGNVQCCESNSQHEETVAAPTQQRLLLPKDAELGVASWSLNSQASNESGVGPSTLQRECEDANAGFAIYWGFDADQRVLRPMCHWTPSGGAAAAEKKAGCNLYTEESYNLRQKPGEGFVGKAYKENDPVFFPDISKLEDMMDLSDAQTRHVDRAEACGIVSLALKPFADGILEIGAVKKWLTCRWIHSVTEDDCEWAAKEAGADFAIYYGFDMVQGILRPMAHWDAPEMMAKMQEKTGSDHLYTKQSYRYSMTPGTGLVGKVFRDQGRMFLPDVSNALDYKRHDLATRFNVKSIALRIFSNGVMEVGSYERWETCDWVSTMGVQDCKWAAKQADADYAIYWGFDKSLGVLRPMKHWHLPERIVALHRSASKHGKKELYTTESYKVHLKPGEGFVGKAYAEKEAMFFPDVCQALEREYPLKESALRFGCVSMALKPMADGVMEIGSTTRWSECEWVSMVTAKDCERAATQAGAVLAIYWGWDEGRRVLRPMAHWNPAQRVAEVIAKTGTDELYTTESYRFMTKPGDGFVGKAFQNHETMLFPDVAELSPTEFRRKELAVRFGLTSFALKPFGNGVMEVGSTTRWEPDSFRWASTVTVEDCQKVCKEAGASFCIFWSLDEAEGVLRAACHWNPPERVAVVKASTGVSELYTTESYKVRLKPGEGIVGSAFRSQETVFVPDVSRLPTAEFPRRDLADRFGIVSLALKPFGSGVYEVGSAKAWESNDWVNRMSVDDCRQACLDAQASYAIFWGFSGGVLRAVCHWDPPERVVAAEGGGELYTAESCKTEMRPGDGIVGKVFQDKAAMRVADVSKLSEAEYKRKALAAKHGISSLFLKPFANGVLEVGSVQTLNKRNWMGA